MYKKISSCRICGNTHLVKVIDLGDQYLTGVFPEKKDESITKGPLVLLKCTGEDCCGLLQLGHSFDLNEMYGENYGYRSGLNSAMVHHLNSIVKDLLNWVDLKENDLIIDIGSNDGTLLKTYPPDKYTLVGIDPTGIKFKEYYPDHIQLITDFFSAELIKDRFGSRKAKVITSIAMLYDLENPLEFVNDISSILDDDGVWVFEQSYMPEMLAQNAFDTICHEHLEYYGLSQIKWMTDHSGLEIVDIIFNDANGGSFRVVTKKKKKYTSDTLLMLNRLIIKERELGLFTKTPYLDFSFRVQALRDELVDFINKVNSDGATVMGYGASTKGNVLLQYCGFTAKDIKYIAEVNEYKYGRMTPGTWIPIISEEEVHSMKPDYLLVLPWHFKNFIVKKEELFLSNNGKLVFPLPRLEVVTK